MTQTPEALTDLLQRVAEHQDHDAFRDLHEALAPRIKGYMMRNGAAAQIAEDLAQEAMLQVWRKAQLFSREKGTVTSWVYTIARNLRIDKFRREYVWQEMPEGHENVPDEAALPDEQVSADERSAILRKALSNLSPEQAEVIELSFVDGLSHSEIAEKLSVPLGTVKWVLDGLSGCVQGC
jgi:RNA polymerase sigma-70 factor (ECF subfamily)